ncbi:hypothetical protein MMC29_007931 [Sticta canariensis]|nr:hypothetical protein [Sticta canariensis]
MSVSSTEKSPVDRVDFEGLQIDTRAKDVTEKCLDPLTVHRGWRDRDLKNEDHLSGKQATAETFLTSPTSSSSTTTGFERGLRAPIRADEPAGPPPTPKARRICGTHRRNFWVIFGILLAIVVIAAVIGGAVAGSQSPGTSGSPNDTNSTGIPSPANVKIGSPLNVVSYQSEGGETFRMYFQSESGNIKETHRTGSEKWTDALPMFTDAVNNTGLATITYLNTSSNATHGSIFYVASSGGKRLLREKRKMLTRPEDLWLDAQLNGQNIEMNSSESANGSTGSTGSTYRMAAVYSENDFLGGRPGCRLFYHTQNATHQYVQEWIWDQTNDTWTEGSPIPDVAPNSHLSATIDHSGPSRTLRLFYVNRRQQLQYSYTNISPPGHGHGYQEGPTFGTPTDTSDIAVVGDNDTTYVYYSSRSSPHESAIQEIQISRSPPSDEDHFHNSSVFAPPPLNTAPYQPLAAVRSKLGRHLFWADHSSSNDSGYPKLWERMITINSTPLTANITGIPLGHQDDDPHIS